MHYHNLYEVTDFGAETFANLTKLFIAASDIPDTPPANEIVSTRCSAMVHSSAQQWKMEGLLVMGEYGKLVKNPVLEEIWDHAVQDAAATRTLRRSSMRPSPGDGIEVKIMSSGDTSSSSVGKPHNHSKKVSP
jgi:hypothetical protein